MNNAPLNTFKVSDRIKKFSFLIRFTKNKNENRFHTSGGIVFSFKTKNSIHEMLIYLFYKTHTLDNVI